MKSFVSKNPATGEKIWEGGIGGAIEVDFAVRRAGEAFNFWSRLPLNDRINFLQKFRDALALKKVHVAELISREVGKPLWDSSNEVEAMVQKVPISIEAYHQRCPEMTRAMPHARSITRHRPLGVLAVLGPFNFPGHLPHGHIIPALLAGNTIVFKPSEYAPLVGQTLVDLWTDVGLPPGVLNVVQGDRSTGALLSEHPEIDGVLFTGSWSAGLHLSEVFAKCPNKMLALEMGGNNPLVIGKISDVGAASYVTIQSAYLTSGQRCTCARRLIVPQGVLGDAFLDNLKEAICSIKVGAYTEIPEPFMGPVISPETAHKLMNVQEMLASKGGVPLVQMSHLKEGSGLLSPGLMDVTFVSDRPDEEFFGPFLQVIRTKTFEESLQEANNTSYGLVAGILSDDRDEYEEFYRAAKAGVVNWNSPLTGASSWAPFGGIGKSGNHRPSAFYAADYCVYSVASIETEKLQVPPSALHGAWNK